MLAGWLKAKHGIFLEDTGGLSRRYDLQTACKLYVYTIFICIPVFRLGCGRPVRFGINRLSSAFGAGVDDFKNPVLPLPDLSGVACLRQ